MEAVAVLVAICALALSLYQEKRRRGDMKRSAQLELRVNQLTVRLTEKLERLKRLNELVGNFHSLEYEWLLYDVLEVPDIQRYSQRASLRVELKVLVKMIEDETLSELVERLVTRSPIKAEDLNAKELAEAQERERELIDSIAGKLHERIYELIK